MGENRLLPTTPGTQLGFTVPLRKRPCWRCRTYRRLFGRRRHWSCTPPPKMVNMWVHDAE